jgi:hypothetical protein
LIGDGQALQIVGTMPLCFRSQAEYLQGLVPRAAVVKAFNVLSAYVLENGGLQGSKEVCTENCRPTVKINLPIRLHIVVPTTKLELFLILPYDNVQFFG